MGASYKVLAPYVTLRVKDFNGQTVVQGFYEGAVVSDPVEDASLDKHVRTKLVEKVKQQDAAPAETDPNAPPKGNSSRDEWAAYATKKGAPAEETRPVEEGGLKQTELRDKYGA